MSGFEHARTDLAAKRGMRSSQGTGILVSGVHMVFGTGEQAVTALEGVDLTVSSGEFVSVVGPSGCGKSTLLRLVADLLEPTAGMIRVRDQSPRTARVSRDIGVVFQRPVLYPWRSVQRQIELPLEVMGYEREERRRLSGEMLELVGLSEFAEHSPWQLSGGMQQRVAIARALSFRPSVLLLDEPFGALDEITRERMQSELQRVWMETDTTVLLITHSIPEAAFLSDRVATMSPRPGRVVAVHDVELARPRTDKSRASSEFFRVTTQIRGTLRS